MKIRKYANDGNTIVTRNIEVIKVNDFISYYTKQEGSYTEYNVVYVAKNIGYLIDNSYQSERVDMYKKAFDENPDVLKNCYLQRIINNSYFNLLEIEICDTIGLKAEAIESRAESIRIRDMKEKEEKEQKAKAKAFAAIEEQNRLNDVFESYKKGEFITAYDFLTICSNLQISIPIQTKGVINKYVYQVSKNSARLQNLKKRKPSLNGLWASVDNLNNLTK